MPVFVLLFLAPVYVPLELLTGWIHAVARYNPVTVALEAGRGLLAGSPVKVALAFALLAGAALVLAVFARRGLAWPSAPAEVASPGFRGGCFR